MASLPKVYGIREIANWILDFADKRGQPLTNMALNKLIYFAYARALVSYNRKLTNAKIEAWEHGPVFREVYRSFKDFGNKPITNRASKYNPINDLLEVAVPELNSEDERIIVEAIEPLMGFSASVLREISHATGGAWDKVWNHDEVTNPGMHITDTVIIACYRSKESLQ